MRRRKQVLAVLSLLIVLSLFFLGYHRPTYVWRILGCFQDIPGNFWLHRVNSPLKMKEFAEKYNGFEMDVIYNEEDRSFNNSHDAGEGDIPLSETLKFFKSSKGAWFDIKNLTEANSFNAEEDLSKIIKSSGIDKSKSIVESHCISCLNIFASKGWKTAYYMISDLDRPLAQNTEYIKEQLSEAQKSKCDYLSVDGHIYDIVKENDLLKNKKYLVWYFWEPWYNLNHKKQYEGVTSDKDVEVILVKDMGHYHR